MSVDSGMTAAEAEVKTTATQVDSLSSISQPARLVTVVFLNTAHPSSGPGRALGKMVKLQKCL